LLQYVQVQPAPGETTTELLERFVAASNTCRVYRAITTSLLERLAMLKKTPSADMVEAKLARLEQHEHHLVSA
jgi:hypothetical protein